MSSRNYDHKKIEQNWRPKWFADNIYKAVDFSEKPKKYILAELPYPSGPYLHAGHMMRYTVPEIHSRFLRMKGYNVMFPMGWDCFGLPAETFAIKEGKTPQEVIAQAEKDFKVAMQRMGYAIDWDREVNTSKPDYYKWTQFMFLKLWEQGLAELREMPVWWCKELGVLADEEVLAGPNNTKVSERGGYPVERKMFKQWNLKITEYADKLLKGLDDTDYMDSVKLSQTNWIGKKEGARIDFEIEGIGKVPAFTTRPDTVFGVSFVAISPEHPLVSSIVQKATNASDLTAYIQKAATLSDLEKQQKEKTGVEAKGIVVKHPFTGNDIPLFIADYILADFGTGFIMGVPAHDDRDFEFASKYGLPIIKVIQTPNDFEGDLYDGDGEVINSQQYNGMNSADMRTKIISDLEQMGIGSKEVTYKLRDQIWARQRYWGEPIPLIHTQDGDIEADYNLPVVLPELKEFLPVDGQAPLTKVPEWVNTTDSKGRPAKREVDTMPTWAGSNWYFIRYIDPQNDDAFADYEKMKYWLPVDRYFGDGGHTTAHLMYSRFWVRALYEQGLIPTPEPFKWRMTGGLLLGEDGTKMSKSKPEYSVDPKDLLENYGADAARMVLAFLGPYSETFPWNSRSVVACYRVIRQIYEMFDKVSDTPASKTQLVAYNKLVKNTEYMYENLKVNTAISEIMIFVNASKDWDTVNSQVWNGFLRVIAPVVPFVAEELWQETHGYVSWDAVNSIHLQDFPTFDEALTLDDVIEVPVQINGKVRAKLSVNANATEEQVKEAAFANSNITKWLDGQEPKKVIYITGRILNIVV
ncbi:leucine--tRNA ligase [candidate division WWE3 bacterium]|uniref:Leucine--tRNA ligase n=1 Tax=candidate division WWE3 bacterium TaxID=2053526 RepID=A0A955EE95_UNCKA|nr:leucine--tRNA ligase [candidate division WWE3 bacterium]